jgi:hypothetical protein
MQDADRTIAPSCRPKPFAGNSPMKRTVQGIVALATGFLAAGPVAAQVF